MMIFKDKNISGVDVIENGAQGGLSSVGVDGQAGGRASFPESHNARRVIAVKQFSLLFCFNETNKQTDQQTTKRTMTVAATAPGLARSPILTLAARARPRGSCGSRLAFQLAATRKPSRLATTHTLAAAHILVTTGIRRPWRGALILKFIFVGAKQRPPVRT
jgi:hypothetical protein